MVFRFWKATVNSLTYFIMKGAFCRCTPLLQVKVIDYKKAFKYLGSL